MQEKKDKIINIIEDFPESLNSHNLLNNSFFSGWFMERLKILRESDRWDSKEIEDIQNARFRNLIMYLYADSIFWKSHLSSRDINYKNVNLSSLEKFPIVGRDFYSNNNIYAIPAEKDIKIHTRYTSGTTNTSLKILISDPEMSLDILSCLFRNDFFNIEEIESLFSKKFILFLGREVLPHYASFSDSFIFDAAQSFSELETRKMLYEELNKDAKIVWAYSSLAREFAHYCKKDGIKFRMKAMLIHSDSITQKEQEYIKKIFQVPIIKIYVSCETAIIGEECPNYFGKNYYHVPRERVILEIVNDDGSPVTPGQEGRLVITVLDRKITPIIRYANGDRGRLLNIKCSCGKASPIFELLGREGEKIILPNNKSFSALLFADYFLQKMGPPRIFQYQIVQRSINDIEVNFVPAKQVNEIELIKIEKQLGDLLGSNFIVKLVRKTFIEKQKSGKMKFFVPLA